MSSARLETYAPLAAIGGLTHGFVLRDPHTAVDCGGREEVLERLQPHYRRSLDAAGVDFDSVASAEQVHGDGVAVVGDAASPAPGCFPAVDGLVTGQAGVTLGIYVADCCAVFLVDPVRRACGLVHSGRKGSELGIAVAAIDKMAAQYGTKPADLVVVLSACIRPPAYEVDFARQIRRACAGAGVAKAQIHDAGADTSRDLQRYYSYRREKGHTGRMLAFLGWKD